MIDIHKEPINRIVSIMSPEDFVDALTLSKDEYLFFKKVGYIIKQRNRAYSQLRKIMPPCGAMTMNGSRCRAKRIPYKNGCKHHATAVKETP